MHAQPQAPKSPDEGFLALKVCPLCGTLNVSSAAGCFVCSWHGRFEGSPELVEDRVCDLVERCPDLIGVLGRPSPLTRARLALRRALSRVLRSS